MVFPYCGLTAVFALRESKQRRGPRIRMRRRREIRRYRRKRGRRRRRNIRRKRRRSSSIVLVLSLAVSSGLASCDSQ